MSECPCKTCGYELEVGDVTCGACGAECDPDEANGFKLERKITRGNTLVIDVRAQNPFTKTAPNSASAGFKVRVTIRENLGDKTATFVGSFDQGDVVDAGGGRFIATIPSEVTYAFADGVVKLYYDVQFVEDGKTWTQEKGLIRVKPTVADFFDPEFVVRTTTHSAHDRKFVEVSASGLTDEILFDYGAALADGQGLKIEVSVFALRDDGSEADSWTGTLVYRKSAGTVVLANEIWNHEGSTAWVVDALTSIPRIVVHSAAATNVVFTARVETMFLKGA